MAEKFSVLIKYKYLDYINNAKLSDADSWVFMKALIEYDKTGKEPKFKKQVLTGLFAVLKCDLDENRERWEERVTTNRANGKKGGRPPKTHNNQNEPKKPSGILETQSGPENPQKPDSGSGDDYGLDSESGSDTSPENFNLDSGGGSYQETEQPPPPIEKIKKESGTWGFFIDTPIARKFQQSGINPLWFVGPHSFLEFAAATVRKKYPDKNNDSLKPIYIAAVTSWDDLREAYPLWRAEQEKKAQSKARDDAIEKAKRNPPKKCQCGGELNNSLVCPLCGGFYWFDDSKSEYKYEPFIDGSMNKRRKKHGKNSDE
jgi:hypothetical protein